MGVNVDPLRDLSGPLRDFWGGSQRLWAAPRMWQFCRGMQAAPTTSCRNANESRSTANMSHRLACIISVQKIGFSNSDAKHRNANRSQSKVTRPCVRYCGSSPSKHVPPKSAPNKNRADMSEPKVSMLRQVHCTSWGANKSHKDHCKT